MGMTHHERETRALLEQYAQFKRNTTHGALYEVRNNATGSVETVLIGGERSSSHSQGGDERKWRAALRDVRRAVTAALGVNFKEEDVAENESRKVTLPPPPQNRGVGVGPAGSVLIGLTPKTTEQRIVMVERTTRIELAPHHVHALLRAAGHDVPDEAKVTFTNEGYVRVAWTKTEERHES